MERPELRRTAIAAQAVGPLTQLRELPPPDRAPFVHAEAARLAEPVVDYVRLQIRAIRS